MKADTTTTEIEDCVSGLIYPAIAIREWDKSVVFYVIARVEYLETTEELLARAQRVAEALTIDRPPSRLLAAKAANKDTSKSD